MCDPAPRDAPGLPQAPPADRCQALAEACHETARRIRGYAERPSDILRRPSAEELRDALAAP